MKVRDVPIDGKTHRFGPLLATTLERHQDELEAAEQGLMRSPAKFVRLVVDVAHASMSRVDPRITRDEVAALVDMDNAQAFFSAAFGASIPEAAAGEAAAASA